MSGPGGNGNDPAAAANAQVVDEFRAGVTACLRSWSALRTAVDQTWGGPDSAAKAEELRSSLLQHFDFRACPIKSLTLDDLEDNLAIYMEEEYSVVLEDASERQVADTIWRMYEMCFRGDLTMARQVVEMGESALYVSSYSPSQLQSAMEDSDDDNDGDGDDGDGENDNDADMMDEESVGEGVQAAPLVATIPLMGPAHRWPAEGTTPSEYAAQPLFGPIARRRQPAPGDEKVRQLGEPAPPVAAPIEVDEDGFASVPAKSRKGGRKPA
jgi:pre-rRNA-processing protein TSR2